MHVPQVPGPEFPAPTAMIWLDMAALVNGGRMAPHIVPFCAVAAVCAAALPALAFMLQRMSQPVEGGAPHKRAELAAQIQHLLPSGIGFAVRFCHPHFLDTTSRLNVGLAAQIIECIQWWIAILL